MIESLQLSKFTTFSKADLEFSPQLNVIIGENGTGKTHLLKILYALTYSATVGNSSHRYSGGFEYKIFEKALSVFGVSNANALVRQNSKAKSIAQLFFGDDSFIAVEFDGFGTVYSSDTFNAKQNPRPIYLPAREVLSIFPNFVSLYESTVLEFDETWRDIAVALGAPQLKNPDKWARKLLEELGNLIGGQIILKDGRFFLRIGDTLREASLLAEGHRKLATVAQLVSNGSIQNGSCLFWDEPEANLNPKLVRQAAQVIMVLAREGVQVFIATHSLFLLRELEILSVTDEVTEGNRVRYFGLHAAAKGVQVLQGDSGDDVGDITVLEEELKQTDRFLQANDLARKRSEQNNRKDRKSRSQ